ncbi:hypothetical protein GC169_05385 [bacterium]|nr:hypothetical protein [bacterium]
MRWLISALAVLGLGACASGPEYAPTLTGLSLAVDAPEGDYQLRAMSDTRATYGGLALGGVRAKADRDSFTVDRTSYATVRGGGVRNALPERAVESGRCFVLLDNKMSAARVWPEGEGLDRYRFRLDPAKAVLDARERAQRAQSAHQAAVRSHASAVSALERARTSLAASPVYRNGACASLSPTPISRPSNAISPSEAARQAESVIQETMVARYGCSMAGDMLARLNRTPRWTGFVAGWACGQAATPKAFPSDGLTFFADEFETGSFRCMGNDKNSMVTRVFCGVTWIATASTRYNQDMETLTSRYSRPYNNWRRSVNAESQRVNSINSTCTSLLSSLQRGPSSISAAERDIQEKTRALDTAISARTAAERAVVSGAALRCR